MRNRPNGKASQWFAIAKADDSSSAEVRIYDEIDPFWGVSADEFASQIADLDVDNLTVRLNSPGGIAYDGVAIYNSLKDHPAAVTIVVDGLAASAASVIAMAGDMIVMNPHSEMMIHNARGLVIGGADDMRSYADHLQRLNDNMASLYAERAGGDVADWQDAMNAETWYSPQEAVDAGLADKLGRDDDETESAAAALIRFRETARASATFTYAGRTAAPAPTVRGKSPSAKTSEAEVTQGKEALVATLQESLIERLGLAEDADEDAITAALDAALDKDEGGDNPSANSSVSSITASAKEHGLAVVDGDVLARLQADAQAGREARAQQERESRERCVDEAISKGKIVPARRDHFLKLHAADPEGTAQLLADLPDQASVPLSEMGHGIDPQEAESNEVAQVKASDKFKNWSI